MAENMPLSQKVVVVHHSTARPHRHVLVLHLKNKYFDQIRAGKKQVEYRRITPYWEKRIMKMIPGDIITILDGYPSKNDQNRKLVFPWDGFKRILLKHEEFGNEAIPVFAIRLNPSMKKRMECDES